MDSTTSNMSLIELQDLLKIMTQEEAAKHIDVTVSTVNRWANTHTKPSKLAAKAIHEAHKKYVEASSMPST